MENKRRRRTIITCLTIAFALVFQIPNLLNFARFGPGSGNRPGRISLAGAARFAKTINMVVPAGWLPYAALTSFEGKVLPAMWGTLGMLLIGTASLKRSYRTTRRLYTGHFSSRKPAAAPLKVPQEKVPSAAFLEKRIPWISEHASAITVACFRSMTRAPESKTMLLTPLVFTLIFGSTFLRVHANPSESLRAFMSAAVMGMVLLGLFQVAGNQFGFDRSGFRVFVLSGASRKDILLGKNLAMLPFALGLGIIGTMILQYAYPMRIDRLLAALIQMVSMYLPFSLSANFLSIFAPAAVGSGSLRPARPKGMTALIQILFFFIVQPLALAPTLIPLGVEYSLNLTGVWPYAPVFLLLAVLQFAVILYLYPRALGLQARLLQAREQKILEVVTARVE